MTCLRYFQNNLLRGTGLKTVNQNQDYLTNV